MITNLAVTFQNLESACKSYSHRTRIQAMVKVEKLAAQANELPVGSPEWKAIVARIVKIENAIS